MLPISILALVLVGPGLFLWLGSTDADLIIATGLITCIHLLSTTGLPMYHFLMAKGYPGKIIVVQLINATVNMLLFFVTFQLIGFVSVPVANATAALASTVYLYLLQRKTFGSTPISSRRILGATLVFLMCCIGMAWTMTRLVHAPVFLLLLYPICICILTVAVYRGFRVVSSNDVDRYLGQNSRLAQTFRFIFVNHG
jgi:O-antigen/teichoic acid export membrane protein